MFTLIHGEDQIKSRQIFREVIDQAKAEGSADIISLSGKNLTLDMLMQNLESHSFFGQSTRLTVLEDLYKMRSKTDLKSISAYIGSLTPPPNNFLVWESKELTPTQLKSFVGAKIITAKISPVIFKLTDSIVPHPDLKNLLSLFYTACKENSAEMVITMLARQIRLMISTFDPNSKLPPWQKGKLAATAKQFGIDPLTSLHHDLAEIDFANKTGQLVVDLQSELALWFTKL